MAMELSIVILDPYIMRHCNAKKEVSNIGTILADRLKGNIPETLKASTRFSFRRYVCLLVCLFVCLSVRGL